jgi:signal transduction histidine kinase
LSLVKWIVDRHEGRIEVQSGIGRGSSFAIWLPAGSVS